MKQQIFIGKELLDMLPALIREAKVSIRLAMYQLTIANAHSHIALQRLWQELEKAPGRNLTCWAILAEGSGLVPGAISAQRSAELLRKAGWSVCMASNRKMMHAKCLIIDNHSLVIGSHNWTASGLMVNTELSVLTKDCGSVADAIEWHRKEFV